MFDGKLNAFCSMNNKEVRAKGFWQSMDDALNAIDEIADVIIRLCDLCGELNIDIEQQIAWKFNHNKQRENKHGKSF